MKFCIKELLLSLGQKDRLVFTQEAAGMEKLCKAMRKPCKTFGDLILNLNYRRIMFFCHNGLFRCCLPRCNTRSTIKPLGMGSCSHKELLVWKTMRRLWEGHIKHMRGTSHLSGGTFGNRWETIWRSYRYRKAMGNQEISMFHAGFSIRR